MRRNYHRKLWGRIITGNYEEKLSQEIMKRNYHRKLWEEIITGKYEEKLSAKNVGILGILPYPKIKSSAKEGTVASPSLLEGNVLRTAHRMWGNH